LTVVIRGIPRGTAIAAEGDDPAAYIPLLVSRVHQQDIAIDQRCHRFIASLEGNICAQLECLSVVVRVITVRLVIPEGGLWIASGMIRGNVDAPLEPTTIKLHALSRCVGVAPPIFAESVCRVSRRLVGAVHL